MVGFIAGATALYLWSRKAKRAAPPPTVSRPQLPFGADADLAFYAARFVVGIEAIEPEHLLAMALYDPRLGERLRARGVTAETARLDLLATARHVQSPMAELHDFNPGETYGGAAVSLRLLVSGRRAHELAARRGAATISLGDLLRAFRERGGLLGQLIGDEDLAAFDVVRAVDVTGRTVAGADAAGDVEVYAVNDDKSSMDLVLALLTEVWELPPAQAAWVMRETHEKGHGFIGRFPAGTARQRVDRATVAARARNMPLGFAVFLP